MNRKLVTHKHKLPGEFPCKYCDEVFRWRSSLDRHITGGCPVREAQIEEEEQTEHNIMIDEFEQAETVEDLKDWLRQHLEVLQ